MFISFVFADTNAPLGGWKDVLKDADGKVLHFERSADAARAAAYAEHDGIFYQHAQVVDLAIGAIVFDRPTAHLRQVLNIQGSREIGSFSIPHITLSSFAVFKTWSYVRD